MKRTAIIVAALLAAAIPAQAGQLLYNGPGGLHYSRPFADASQRGYGYGNFIRPRGYAQPGYLRPPTGPYLDRRGPPLGAILGGVLAGAAAAVIPQVVAPPPPMPMARPVAAPLPEPEGDAMDAIPDASPNSARITRQEIEAALADWCGSHADAPLCVKLAR